MEFVKRHGSQEERATIFSYFVCDIKKKMANQNLKKRKKEERAKIKAMATVFTKIEMNKIDVGPEETGNNGGKYRKLSYNNGQFKDIQLGESIQDTIRCPFGVESASQSDPTKLHIKLDISPKLASFITAFDDVVKKSVNDTSMTHTSALKTNGQYNTLKVKVVPETNILVTTLKDGNKITTPVPGKIHDIRLGSMILPIVKVQGGVYYINTEDKGTLYGTSFVVTQILVVHNPQKTEFALGDVVMEDAV